MKIITALAGTVQDQAEWPDPRGCVTALLDEPQPGYLRKIHLNGGGLTIESGPLKVGIPLAALLALVEQCEPGLIPPAPDQAKPDAVKSAAAAIVNRPKV